MAHIVNPYNLDDDDDAVFSALLSQGLIWVHDDDNHNSETEESELPNEIEFARSITSRKNELHDTPKPKHENAAKTLHRYDGNDVLQAAHDFIHSRDEEWVNFNRLSSHLYKTFGKLNLKKLERPNKKYKNLLKFFADYPSKFDLRQDDEKSGLYWIRLKTH